VAEIVKHFERAIMHKNVGRKTKKREEAVRLLGHAVGGHQAEHEEQSEQTEEEEEDELRDRDSRAGNAGETEQPGAEPDEEKNEGEAEQATGELVDEMKRHRGVTTSGRTMPTKCGTDYGVKPE